MAYQGLTRVSCGPGRPTCETLTCMTNPAQHFTVTTAADACRVSRKTITRRLPQLQASGAFKDDAGSWVLPLNALLHAGFTPGRPTPPDSGNGPQQDTQGQADRGWYSHDEVAELRRRAEVAEALAAERDRIIEAQARALRMLEAGGQRIPDTSVHQVPATTPAAPTTSEYSTARRGPLERLVGRLGL